jgi:hypothetical protein
MVKKNGLKWILAGMICVLIIPSYLMVYYYEESSRFRQLFNETLNELKKFDKFIFVNISINYENGTNVWYNNTLVIRGADLLNATRIIADIDFTKGQYGVFVTKINGVGQDPNTYWLWYSWNSTTTSWEYGSVASDQYILHEGDTLEWTYTQF